MFFEIDVLLKVLIIVGVFMSSYWGPRLLSAIFGGDRCGAGQVRIVACGLCMIVGGILFLYG
jgi:hypothetical protein